jgi:hypothetical protein
MMTMQMTCADIARSVAAKYGLTLEDLRQKTMRRDICWPRQEAMYEIRRVWGDLASFPWLAKFFRLRDHTTVIWAVRSHADRHGLPHVTNSKNTRERRRISTAAWAERSRAKNGVDIPIPAP